MFNSVPVGIVVSLLQIQNVFNEQAERNEVIKPKKEYSDQEKQQNSKHTYLIPIYYYLCSAMCQFTRVRSTDEVR